jgi:malonate-semialdehyde dehydrogenase (acetylating)/methylmalonate-semialdehyde dehydrogenase
MGPVISAAARQRITAAIELGEREGGKILLDGRGLEVKGLPKGNWLGPTLIELDGPTGPALGVVQDMTLAREEVFGPVMVLRRAKDLDEAIEIVHRSPYANACSIVTESGAAARKFQYEVGVSMLGVNIGVAAPMAFFPFGGAKQSFFGDLKAHGSDSIRFFTDAKVVIARWD